MSLEEPTPLEIEYVTKREAYEAACLEWAAGKPWPIPPAPINITFRPTSLFDDPHKWMHAMSNYYLAVQATGLGSTAKIPLMPKKLPGRLKKDPRHPTLPKKPGRPKQFQLREDVGLTKWMVDSIEKERQPGDTYPDVIRRCLMTALCCGDPALEDAVDRQALPDEKRPETIARLTKMFILFDEPDLAAALDKEALPNEKRPETIIRLLKSGLLP